MRGIGLEESDLGGVKDASLAVKAKSQNFESPDDAPYARLKFAVSEENPTIKPYDEAIWAGMADARLAPVEISLGLLDGLHARLVWMLRSLAEADFARRLFHPERGGMSIDDYLALYDWHSRHHTAHVTALRDREGW